MKLYKCSNRVVFYTDSGFSHRLNGPAVIRADGRKEYYQNGLLHRENGPAVIYANGTKEYWIKGKKYTKKEFDDKKSTIKIKDSI